MGGGGSGLGFRVSGLGELKTRTPGLGSDLAAGFPWDGEGARAVVLPGTSVMVSACGQFRVSLFLYLASGVGLERPVVRFSRHRPCVNLPSRNLRKG